MIAGADEEGAPRRLSPWTENLRYAMSLEPRQHALPTIFGGLLAVARPVIGVEGVWHALVDVDPRFLVVAEGVQPGAQALDLLERNALVGAAIQAKHRPVDLVGDIERPGRHRRRNRHQRAVPGDAGVDLLVVRGVHPHHAAAAAEAGDAELLHVGALVLGGPRDHRV